MKKLYATFLLFTLFTAFSVEAVNSYVAKFPSTITTTNEEVQVFYQNNTLYIKGYKGNANVDVFNMLGKKVASYQNLELTNAFTKAVTLPKNNIFIVSVQTDSFKKSFKIVTK